MSVVSPRPSTTSAVAIPVAAGADRRQSGLKPRLSRQLLQPYTTPVEYKAARFLITDQPNPATMQNFILTCQQYEVRLLVRVCKATYDESALEQAGIKVVDLEFDDGSPPPDSVILAWFQLITDHYRTHPSSYVAVHCKAGLGRAPALVAVALVELGLPYDKAISMICSLRPGAFNTRQIQYLQQFRSHKRLRLRGSAADRCWVL